MRERAARENWTLKPVPIPQPRDTYLGTVLQLQDQIEILKKLSERQDALGKLRESYGSLGIPFTAPPPTRSVCEKIPPSLVCVQAYPDLLKVAIPESDLEETPLVATPPVASVKRPVPVDIGPEYRWTDVTCAGGACRAVLVEADNPRARRTVSEGEVLPGGAVVSRIAFEGVRVNAGGEDQALAPAVAPSRGGSSSPLFSINRSQTAPAVRKRAPAIASSGGAAAPAGQDANKEAYKSEAQSLLKTLQEKSPRKKDED